MISCERDPAEEIFVYDAFNSCPAEPRYTLPLQTV